MIALFGALAGIVLLGGAAGGGMGMWSLTHHDEVSASVVPPEQLIAKLPSGGARIYDRHGQLLYEFVDELSGLRRPVALSEISPWMTKATVSTEDASFYTNNGLNTQGLARAAVENLTPFGSSFERLDVDRTRRVPFWLIKVMVTSERESLTFPTMKFRRMMSVASGSAAVAAGTLPALTSRTRISADGTIDRMVDMSDPFSPACRADARPEPH